jgi:hypothetical protein
MRLAVRGIGVCHRPQIFGALARCAAGAKGLDTIVAFYAKAL